MSISKDVYDNLNKHYVGITIITLSFIYLLYACVVTKTVLPKYFFLLYSIGGFILMNKFIYEKNLYVTINEFIGASIALFLFFYVKQNL
jgi:hypothetical protein